MCLLLLALLGQSPSALSLAPHWIVGQELLFRGTVRDEVIGPTTELSSQYQLEIRALILNQQREQTEIACCTKLTLLPGSIGSQPPASIQLTRLKVDPLGRIIWTNHPHGRLLPMESPATGETGWLLPVPSNPLAADAKWEIADPSRLPRRFQIESTTEALCQIVSQQESFDWSSPRADSTAWKRSETLAIDLKKQLCVKFSRRIERRAPAHQKSTARLITDYELSSSRVLEGPLLAVQRRDIEKICHFQEQLQTLAAASQAKDCSTEFQRLSRELNQFQQSSGGTPYRETLSSLQALVQAGLENRLASLWQAAASPLPLPDCRLTRWNGKDSVTLSQFRGRPLLLVFIKPGSTLTPQIAGWATAFQSSLEKQNFACLYLSIPGEDSNIQTVSANEPVSGIQVFPGQALASEQKVTETPHFLLLNADGLLTFSATGWGPETRRDIEKRLRLELVQLRKFPATKR